MHHLRRLVLPASVPPPTDTFHDVIDLLGAHANVGVVTQRRCAVVREEPACHGSSFLINGKCLGFAAAFHRDRDRVGFFVVIAAPDKAASKFLVVSYQLECRSWEVLTLCRFENGGDAAYDGFLSLVCDVGLLIKILDLDLSHLGRLKPGLRLGYVVHLESEFGKLCIP